MTLLHTARKALHLTQQEMADRCGLSRYVWRALEAGLSLPTPAQAGQIEAVCGHPIPSSHDLLSPQEIRNWFRRRRFALAPFNPEPWQRMRRNPRVDKESACRYTLEWAERLLPCDSALEAQTWLEFILLGARPLLANPHELGCEWHPIVDHLGKALGCRYLPGLQGRYANLRYAIWPQVNLRTAALTLRVDGLLWARIGTKSTWETLEIDGGGHDSRKDAYRNKCLGKEALRFSQEQVDQLQVKRLFLQGCQKALANIAAEPKVSVG